MGSGDIYTNAMRVIAKQMDVDDALAMKTLERMRRESAIYNPFPSTGETSYVPSTGETSYVHNIARVCLAVVGLACGMRPRRAVLLSLRPGLASALAGAIEPDATSLKFLAEEIEKTIQQMRELGRQPLTAQTGNLTVVTTQFAAQKGNSAIQAWALNLKDAMENALRYTAMWLKEEAEAEFELPGMKYLRNADMTTKRPTCCSKCGRETGKTARSRRKAY
jgi:hypothetical protein